MAVAQVFEKASADVVERRAALAAVGALTLGDASPRSFEPIAVPEPLTPLLPEGIRRGEALALPGDAPAPDPTPPRPAAPARAPDSIPTRTAAPARDSIPTRTAAPVPASVPPAPTRAVRPSAAARVPVPIPGDAAASSAPDPVPFRTAALTPTSAPFGVAAVDYLTLALLAGALRQGLWCAAVGVRGLGGAALAELLGAEALREGALQRLLVVARPGERWAEIATVLADGVDLVLLSPPDAVPAQVARRVDARLRQGAGDESRHRAALLVLGAWPGARTTLRVRRLGWTGFDAGTGHLVAGQARIDAEDRTRRRRSVQVLLPEDLGAETPLSASTLARPDRDRTDRKEGTAPRLTAVA
jgi:hypothetical protein